MAPTPAQLRTAADGLRTTARRLDLDLGPLAEKGDGRTWEGQAATGYRRAATDAEARGRRVTDGLRRIAARLDATATQVEQAEQAARLRVEEARRDQLADRAAEDLLHRPMWTGPVPGAPAVTTGSDPSSAADLFPLGGGDRG